jgi:hypothetical protein
MRLSVELRSLFLAVGIAALVGACSDSVDRAAKKRIFSPEDPPRAVASATEKLAPEEVADKPQIARRILGMGAAETTERLGAHKYTATVTFDWSGGGRATKLIENRTLYAGQGGVSGDFHGVMENSRDQGLEVLRVQGKVFAKNRYGKYRQRLRDRGIAEREREEIYGALREFDSLFKGRLKLTPQGTASHDGRTAWKYAVSLGPALAVAEASHLPPVVQPKAGIDETTARRRTFFEKREPSALQGEVLVDAETSVVLKAQLDGKLSVNGEAGEAKLRLVLQSALSNIGKDPALKAPADFLPDEDKPEGIEDALERFGIPRVGPDGGTLAPPGAAPPDEDSE